MALSPSKRHALAPLDANAASPAPRSSAPRDALSKPTLLSPLPMKIAPPLSNCRKRPLADADENSSPTPKKHFREHSLRASVESLSHAVSPAQGTRSHYAAPLSPRTLASKGHMTREQVREKAEILRLRLGLATYKVRTGQANVPLDQLKFCKPTSPSTPSTKAIPSPLPPVTSPPAVVPCSPPRLPSVASTQSSNTFISLSTTQPLESSDVRETTIPQTPPAMPPDNIQDPSDCIHMESSLQPVRETPSPSSLPPPSSVSDSVSTERYLNIEPVEPVASRDETFIASSALSGLLSLSRGSAEL